MSPVFAAYVIRFPDLLPIWGVSFYLNSQITSVIWVIGYNHGNLQVTAALAPWKKGQGPKRPTGSAPTKTRGRNLFPWVETAKIGKHSLLDVVPERSDDKKHPPPHLATPLYLCPRKLINQGYLWHKVYSKCLFPANISGRQIIRK